MREPELGEILRCQTCGEEIRKIDEEWMKSYRRQTLRQRRALYDAEKDCFLDYDGCEQEERDRKEPGIKEEHRSYIRGTSYRPL